MVRIERVSCDSMNLSLLESVGTSRTAAAWLDFDAGVDPVSHLTSLRSSSDQISVSRQPGQIHRSVGSL
jgi:hypothetical protein